MNNPERTIRVELTLLDWQETLGALAIAQRVIAIVPALDNGGKALQDCKSLSAKIARQVREVTNDIN